MTHIGVGPNGTRIVAKVRPTPPIRRDAGLAMICIGGASCAACVAWIASHRSCVFKVAIWTGGLTCEVVGQKVTFPRSSLLASGTVAHCLVA